MMSYCLLCEDVFCVAAQVWAVSEAIPLKGDWWFRYYILPLEHLADISADVWPQYSI